MSNKFTFLGLNFNLLTINEALNQIEDAIRKRTAYTKVFSISAELAVMASKDLSLRAMYNETDILTVDGYVMYYAARLFGKPVLEPVSASRLMFRFMERALKNNYRLYLLGATEEVVTMTRDKLAISYPGINIVGCHNGYFDQNADTEVVRDIVDKKPDVLFIAMSSPLKEKFVVKNLISIKVPVTMGVGGAFDIIAGKCKLAPEWLSKLGLEWFYRFIQEPRRMWIRYLVKNTQFILLVIKSVFKSS